MANEKMLIDAYELRTQFDDIPPFIGMTGGCVQQYIDKAPTVDAVEVKHGRWIGKGGLYQGECSVCGYMTFDKTAGWVRSYWHYCPNCGAKMDGDGNGC